MCVLYRYISLGHSNGHLRMRIGISTHCIYKGPMDDMCFIKKYTFD